MRTESYTIDDAWVGKRNGRRLPGSDSNGHEHMTPASGTPSGGLLVEEIEEASQWVDAGLQNLSMDDSGMLFVYRHRAKSSE